MLLRVIPSFMLTWNFLKQYHLALHEQLAPNFERLDGHYAAICKECNRQPSHVAEKHAQRKSSVSVLEKPIFVRKVVLSNYFVHKISISGTTIDLCIERMDFDV